MEVFENCSNLIGCKYLLVADTRLCQLSDHKGGKVKTGCSWLLPYVQKLVTMQCDELGLPRCGVYYAKSSKCKASLHGVRCHQKPVYFSEISLQWGSSLRKLIVRAERSEISEK